MTSTRAQVHITSEGRGGSVHYEHGTTRFAMWWEFAGSTALAIIGVPSSASWTTTTGLPLDQRDDTLRFIGQQVVNQQTSGAGTFTYDEQTMTIFTR